MLFSNIIDGKQSIPIAFIPDHLIQTGQSHHIHARSFLIQWIIDLLIEDFLSLQDERVIHSIKEEVLLMDLS